MNRSLMIALTLSIWACDDGSDADDIRADAAYRDTGPTPDAGPEPDASPGADGGADPDTGPDRDTGPDPDAGPDPDGGPDPDSGPDPDGGPPPDAGDPWEGCPAADTAVVDPGWIHTLRAPAAEYCASFDENRDLRQERALKAVLRLAPGDYPLPTEGTEADFALPFCIQTADGTWRPDGVGRIGVQTNAWQGRTNHRYSFSQPMTDGTTTRQLEGTLNMVLEAGEAPETVLDGRPGDPYGDDDGFDLVLCAAGDFCYGIERRDFDSCAFEGIAAQRHQLTLDRGELTLTLRIGESVAATEPGAFVRAHGTLDGAAFDVKDYWQLIYRPTHHHFGRDFAVLFDEPIGDACGIEISGVSPWPDEGTPEAWTIDCALDRLAPLRIDEQTYQHDGR